AHELAHVKHRDTLISTISATVAGAISAIAQFGMFFSGGRGDDRPNPIIGILMMFLAPMAAGLIQMAISRAREFEADRGGAEISRDPKSLASALEKIHNYAHQIPNMTAEAHPETGQMMIINPLSGVSFDSLFSTHPKTEERIAKLMALANQY
ncbi:MAG: M48 family metalloprotease, partial [Methylophilus sp.]